METTKQLSIGDGTLTFATGKLTKQAGGSVTVTSGDSVILATACSAPVREALDYIPLLVEYNERYYAAGKIPGGFFKREGRPKEREILVSRLIDRPMRPLFHKALQRDIQIIPTVLSTDQKNPTDVLAINAASAAVVISDIPFDGPVAAVRVIYRNGDFTINPTFEEISNESLNIIVAGTRDGITMVEGGGNEVSEDILLEAIELATQPIIDLCNLQLELAAEVGKQKLPLQTIEDEKLSFADQCSAMVEKTIEEAFKIEGKHNRSSYLQQKYNEYVEEIVQKEPDTNTSAIKKLIEESERMAVRRRMIDNEIRIDGRKFDEIRHIDCEIELLPRAHGTALFTRGETQALVVTTLGTVFDEQIMDDIEGDRREHFMLHYNFPPYSVGETGRLMTGRREIGHGALARRALQPLVPSKEKFPYTMRVVSEILESNGSSSMASVCGASLSFMQAGVPIKATVAGIAMGMVQEDDATVILSDILGEEDHLGDMDFKVAGTAEGITAFQMDIKVKSISPDTMKIALEQARVGRLHIIEKMNEVIKEPKTSLSEHAPSIISMKIDPDKIGVLIGTGGKTIRNISEKHSVETNIGDDGTLTIYSKEQSSAEAARVSFLKLLEEPEIGKIYEGTVRRITEFGAFIEFLPSKEGLCHISKMSKERTNNVNDVLELNQVVPIKIVDIDRLGRVDLTLLVDEDISQVPKRSFDPSRSGPRQFSNNRDRDNDRNDRRRGGGGGGGRDRNNSGSRSDKRNHKPTGRY